MTEPRDEFASALHQILRPVPDEPGELEETEPRSPRPDLSQASGANGSAVTDPGSTFAAILHRRLGGFPPDVA